MTEELFRADSYARHCQALITAVDERGIQVDRTVFYPLGGGQPGDSGRIVTETGAVIVIGDSRRDRETGAHLHIPEGAVTDLAPGMPVSLEIDWQRRYPRMRMHTCLHLLCAVVDGAVTGGQIGGHGGDGVGRLDFNLPDGGLDKAAIEADLNRLIGEDHAIACRWISDADLVAHPELVRTMSVSPPTGQGRVRLVEVGDVDLQPCGGTHVRSTAEIGPVVVTKIENKGRRNRRIRLALT